MYDASDPRAALTPAAETTSPPATAFAGAEYAKFYESNPQEQGPQSKTWFARGQNFNVAYSEAQPGVVFERNGQPDEYVVLVPDAATTLAIKAGEATEKIAGHSLAIVPPGNSTVTVPKGGRIVRFFSTRSVDLAAKCSNAASYVSAHPNIPAFEPWPQPRNGYRIRVYGLDVPPQAGRFG